MNISYDDWLQIGILAGWAEEFCYTHEKRPMTDDEWVEFYGSDPHIRALAIWPGSKPYRIPLPAIPDSD
jgi:CTP:phosphocholine cytidylyltransferase-like protein